MEESKEMEGLLDLVLWVLGQPETEGRTGHYRTLYKVMRARGATDLEIRQGLEIRMLRKELHAKT